ncbi:MAG TPA: hypothetical protein VN618_10635 [Solirubrobacteraceae bacterium]|nr:hypothetical protein [Solirubrobacteraceae bacterium]
MSASQESNGRTEAPGDGAGVLSNLPRTRPQRATARRAAARTQREAGGARASRNGAGTRTKAKAAGSAAKAPAKAAGTAAKAPAKAARSAAKAGRSAKAPAKGKPQADARGTQAKATPKRAPRRVAAPREEVPRQGFECIEERATGAVPPPGGPEFVGTAAEIVGELAKAGVAGGERLLRDVFSRLGL